MFVFLIFEVPGQQTQGLMSAFSDRLFSEDGSEIPDDEIFASSPVKLMLVILEFFQTDAEQTQRMISASTNNELIELESLLKNL